MKMAAGGAAVAVCHTEPAPSLSRTQDYGGYLSTSILPARDANQGPMFACGAALSPITDFRLHGTVGRSPPRAGAASPAPHAAPRSSRGSASHLPPPQAPQKPHGEPGDREGGFQAPCSG